MIITAPFAEHLYTVLFISFLLLIGLLYIPERFRRFRFLNFLLSIALIGAGQAYNKHFRKAFVLSGAWLGALLLLYYDVIGDGNMNFNTGDSNIAAWIFLPAWGFAIIDGLWFTETETKRTKRLLKLRRKERALAKEIREKQLLVNIRTAHQNDQAIGLDTNILMHEEDVIVNELVKGRIFMSWVVLNELDGLKKSHNKDRRRRAQQAFDRIETFQTQSEFRIVSPPEDHYIRKQNLNAYDNDDKIVATYLKMQQEGEKISVFANDKNVRIKCRQLQVPVIEAENVQAEADAS
ncbi:PIN domain-containing protein [Salsuginibacillus kocurii]|uniref:PIN domain-containing protein n=1 Tax=Salsuginibacillus kocurii TaxID=427078 RepID=UPI00037418B9|nr:PIN domain-containing protein [Salsuginibacillus kocurii]